MARRSKRKGKGTSVSLFSFLDILGGTIGILTLIIAIFMLEMKHGKQIVQLVSEGSHFQSKKPSYFICESEWTMSIHHDEMVLPNTSSWGNHHVKSVLKDIRTERYDRYLIIGVRPNGYQCFERMRDQAEEAGIDVGYEPIDDGWRIRTSGGNYL